MESDPAMDEDVNVVYHTTEKDRHEILENYFERNTQPAARVRVDGKTTVTKELDPISEETIGRADTKVFQEFARRKLSRSKFMLEWALEVCALLDGKVTKKEKPPLKEDIPSVRLAKDVIPHIEDTLLQCQKRKRGEKEGEKPRRLLGRINAHAQHFAHCGLFMVPKKVDLWRLIFDARPANMHLQRLEGFRLFSLQQLLGTVRGISARGKWWCRTFDFRHYFYQIRLHKNFHPYFRIGRDMVPLVLTMGFHSAPMVAQSITWTSILWHEVGDEPKYIKEFPHKEMPPYLPLVDEKGNDVGAIFVLLDNIMIASNDQGILEYWEERINKNIARLKLQVKEGDESQLVAIPERGSQEEPSRPAVFAGIEFSHLGWRSHSAERELPTPDTRRNVSRVCGALMWDLRVREERLINHLVFLQLLQRIGVIEETLHGKKKRRAPEAREWNTLLSLSPIEKSALEQLASAREDRAWYWPKESEPISATYTTATDATEETTAWARLHLPSGTASAGGARDHSGDDDHHLHADVDYYELLAVLEMAQQIRQEHDSRATAKGEHIRIVVVLDSMIAKMVIEKGHSRSAKLCPLLRELFNLNITFVCLWICSEGNVADTPSRHTENSGGLEHKRIAATLAVANRFFNSGCV